MNDSEMRLKQAITATGLKDHHKTGQSNAQKATFRLFTKAI